MTQIPLNGWKDFGLFTLPEYQDGRGALGVAETDNLHFPFPVRRVFWIRNVPAGQTRGSHAHRTCAEVLIALSGSLKAHVANATRARDFSLNSPTQGLFIPAMTWCSFSDFTPDCICLCLASHPYEREGYINSLADFYKETKP